MANSGLIFTYNRGALTLWCLAFPPACYWVNASDDAEFFVDSSEREFQLRPGDFPCSLETCDHAHQAQD